MRTVIRQSVVLPAPAEKLFEMYINPSTHQDYDGVNQGRDKYDCTPWRTYLASMKISLTGFAFVVAISLLSSCSTNAPLKTLYYKTDKYASQKSMIIFLRGRRGSHEDFASEGLITDIIIRKLPLRP